MPVELELPAILEEPAELALPPTLEAPPPLEELPPPDELALLDAPPDFTELLELDAPPLATLDDAPPMAEPLAALLLVPPVAEELGSLDVLRPPLESLFELELLVLPPLLEEPPADAPPATCAVLPPAEVVAPPLAFPTSLPLLEEVQLMVATVNKRPLKAKVVWKRMTMSLLGKGNNRVQSR